MHDINSPSWSATHMKQRLHYRRQFLLAEAPIKDLTDWKCIQIDKYYLFAHPDLEVNRLENPRKSIIIIGNIYDSAQSQKGNADILKDIMTNASDMKRLVLWMKRYAGRYTLLYIDDKDAVMLPDALALKEIYYCTKDNRIVCGSQPNLVAEFSNPQIEATSDANLLEFYRNHTKNSKWNPVCKWIGDETCFENVKHLLPNHYLDIKRREILRFWPNESIKRLSLEEAVSKSCSYLQGYIKAMVHQHPVMMAVTAGWDSRTLLAASRGIKDDIYYFVNNEGLGFEHPDIRVPKEIFESIGLPFHVHDIPADVDEEFRRIFLNNAFFASERILPTIYNVYFKRLGEKVNILGIGEIGRTSMGKDPRNLNGYRLAYKTKHKDNRYMIKKCEQILAGMFPSYKKFNINVLTGFYWEQILGNWGSTGNSESDIAIEEVNPFNSHLLYETFLGVDEKYTKYKNNILFKKMIQKMWPELMEWPINPSSKLRDKLIIFMNDLGLFEIFKEFKYQLNYLRYVFRTRFL